MTSSDKKIKVGVIGLGVGEAHISGYLQHPLCELRFLCDKDSNKLKEVAAKHPNAQISNSAEDVLESDEVDVVSIASYDNYHCEQIITALSNNKHVFAEKPLCLTATEAKEIHNTLKSKPDLKLSCNHILRTSPRFLDLKAKINRNELGELNYIEGDYNYGRIEKITKGWRGKIPFYSAVHGGGLHLIDLILWLTGDRVKAVSAIGNNIASKGSQYKFNDVIVALLEMESGLSVKVCSNFSCVLPHFHVLNVYGTKGTFINNRETADFYTSRDPQQTPIKLDTAYPGVSKGGLIPDFINAILENKEPYVAAKEVFDAMSVCFAIEEAMKSAKVCEVSYLEDL